MCSRIVVDTPIGRGLELVSDGSVIVNSRFVSQPNRSRAKTGDTLLREAKRQVDAYFKRTLRRFDLPYRFEGTELQCAIWRLVTTLENGEIASYADIARAVGRPLAHRAVAMAMKQSPMDLLIPAHRIVGSDGRVKGASAHSMRWKLLRFEGFRLSRDGALLRAIRP